MSWESEAWRAAAQTYGAARAEKWGRWHRAWTMLRLLACAALAVGIVALWIGR